MIIPIIKLIQIQFLSVCITVLKNKIQKFKRKKTKTKIKKKENNWLPPIQHFHSRWMPVSLPRCRREQQHALF